MCKIRIWLSFVLLALCISCSHPSETQSSKQQDLAISLTTAERGLTFIENAHLFALLTVSMADAGIACWDGKYRYVFWRPITAIRAGLTPADADPTWVPWLDFFPTGTPPHPEYRSGHSTVSGAAAFILIAEFGNNTAFSVTSDVRPGTRTFSSFTDAAAEIADARVFGGIHFEFHACAGTYLVAQWRTSSQGTRCSREAKTVTKTSRQANGLDEQTKGNPGLR
jgi:hypothetical protein